MKLSELQTGKSGIIVKVSGSGKFRKRIIEMGFVGGERVDVLLNAPLRDPIKYKVMDYEVSLRRKEADLVEIITEEEAKLQRAEHTDLPSSVEDTYEVMGHIAGEKSKTINVALIGNPNSGKTSLFNIASGAHEHVGNYTGVTVDAKEGHFEFEGYSFNIFDLPGTYSLSTYTPEEIYVRKHIFNSTPDVIINIVGASSLERNLYLTTQLIDMDIPTVIALNMYDELQKSGASLDTKALGSMFGMPVIPTVASEGFNGNSGLKELFETVIKVYTNTEPTSRHIHINHCGELQEAIDTLNKLINKSDNFSGVISSRFYAVKLMERDAEIESYIKTLTNSSEIFAYRDKVITHIESELEEDCESAIINAKYGFIQGALAETYKEGEVDAFKATKVIDAVVTHKFWGFPIFILFMLVMFECTFVLGQYPMDWIESGFEWLASTIGSSMADGPLKDLLINGIISGVGGVLVFLPNILILYFFISLMEDSGYLSRAAFIMDKIMHRMGLHGKSFVPMLMGFGCSVPAVMATRTLESKSSRLITMLVTPFMSCSARLPVYLIFTAIFFPKHAGLVMLSLYLLGIVIAVIMARILKRTLFKEDDIPFVMELPPYRVPTVKSALHHMWEKSKQYLKKMGTIILFASIIIWALGYFPRPKTNNITVQQQLEQSFIGKIGKFIEPVMEPLGFDWRMSVSLAAGLPAKEVVVSTLSVLYTGNDESDELEDVMLSQTKPDGTPLYTPLVAFTFMVFVLLYFPCIATLIAIKQESGSWKWAPFSALYSTTIAWIVCFIIYQLGSLII